MLHCVSSKDCSLSSFRVVLTVVSGGFLTSRHRAELLTVEPHMEPWSSLPCVPHSQLRPFSAGRLPGFTCLPLAALWSGDCLQAVRWGIHWAHLICFLTFRNHYFSLSGIQCLENHCFMYFVGYFNCLRWGYKSHPYCSISAGHRNPHDYLFLCSAGIYGGRARCVPTSHQAS